MRLSPLVVAVTALLFVALSSCRATNHFSGPVRDLIPPQVGRFKLKGEVKPVTIGPPEQYQKGALRPTEGAEARYESPDGSQLALQVVNYSSQDAALATLKQMRENIEKFESGAKVEQGPKRGAEGREVGQRLVVDGGGRSANRVIWTSGSLVYLLAGGEIDSLLEVERNLPS